MKIILKGEFKDMFGKLTYREDTITTDNRRYLIRALNVVSNDYGAAVEFHVNVDVECESSNPTVKYKLPFHKCFVVFNAEEAIWMEDKFTVREFYGLHSYDETVLTRKELLELSRNWK